MSSSDASDGRESAGTPVHLDPELATRLASEPNSLIAVIVTGRGPIEDLTAALPPDTTVTHAYRLIQSLAIEATGATILALAAHPAVAAIEAVRGVEAWSP